MNLLQKVNIKVAEPWDFSSKEGESFFTAVVENKVQQNNNYLYYLYLLRVAKPFQWKEHCVQYLIASPRHIEEDSKAINLYYIPKDDISKFEEIEEIKGKLVFLLIGTYSYI